MSITNESIIERLVEGNDLDQALMRELMERIFSSTMAPAQIAASLVLLRSKKETAAEIFTASDVILQKAEPIERPDYLFADAVGTGGDGHHTINVSTMASLTAASAGLPVAKHGSTSVSSKCGSSELLTELGIDIALKPAQARRNLDEHGWCFLFAPHYHPAYRAVKSIRQELKIRTIFNILGPLVNPLAPPIMLIGVFDPGLIPSFAETLRSFGRRRALIVHGSGLDEIALHSKTTAALLDNGKIDYLILTPDDFGLKSCDLSEVKGGAPDQNAKLCREILQGKSDQAKIDIVAASAGTLLWLGEKADNIMEGVRLAKDALYAAKPLALINKLKGANHGAR